MSENVLLFNDLRSDTTVMPELHEAPIMFRNGEFRYVECITDSPIIAETASELEYDVISCGYLFFALSTDIPVLF